MEKYDVGVLGLWMGCNYGSIATYYALNKVLESMGKSVLMIDKPVLSDKDAERTMTHSRRFANEHYNISAQYPLNELNKLNEQCDAFVIGSDQVWNYGISKNFGKTFYFDFVEESKKKIAYAVSFGHGIDFATPEEREKISKYMEKIDGISVREDEGVKICKEDYNINATHVLDPVFLADPSIYTPLIEKSTANETEPFLVAYILDPTPEKREAILHLSEKLGGIKVINLLDGLLWNFEKNKKATNLPNCIENLQVEDWLYYLSKAEYVITDSCHGASFALIFNKNLTAITNKRRGFSRFKSLFELFDITSHLVTDPKNIIGNDKLVEPIDYIKFDEKMQSERVRCHKWLEKVLNEEKLDFLTLKKRNQVAKDYKLPEEMCMGCGSCVSVCPKNALSLKPDKWGYYRQSLNSDLCIDCGLCIKSCPALSLPQKNNLSEPDCFAFIAKDEDTLFNSSSGAIFPLLADRMLEDNGVIVGAAWKEGFSVEHILVETKEDVEKLKKSKYFQTYMGDTDKKVKLELEKGRKVLFTGCPCQVAGLKKYLGKEYENLYTVDLLCGYSPSSMFFKKYLEESFPQGVKSYQFRYKKEGWNSDCLTLTLTLTLTDGTVIERCGGKEDLYQKLYHTHTMCPVHCEKCQYQSLPRFGDITIGDFWGYSKRDSSVDVSKGISAVLCNNKKGKELFESISSNKIHLKKQVPFTWIGSNGYALPRKHNYASANRNKFYEKIVNNGFSDSLNYALKEEVKSNFNSNLKLNPLQYESIQLHFKYDDSIWEEHFINGHTVLITKSEKSPTGKFAVLPFRDKLIKGKKYGFDIRFKMTSKSSVFNLHAVDIDMPKQNLQILKSCKNENGFSDEWIEEHLDFVANSDFNGFGIGAAQLIGESAYFMVDYIYISEEFDYER